MPKSYVGLITKTYSPRKLEEEVISWWSKSDAYKKAKVSRKNGKKFYFLDGPPYVTNPPHVGTAWNKIMKDVVIRFRRMQGYNVRDQPGYDCHGLPIEVRVEEALGVRTKKEIEEKIGIERFIEECKKFVLKNENVQTNIFKRLGVWMDWDTPYLTYTNSYIEAAWWTLKKADEKKLLDKGLKVVHWCPRCETALAGYEITDEYRIVRDPSIYVKFPVLQKENEYILIWTTTPWTLPGNVAVMVHPEYTYARVKVGKEVFILAEARCEPVFGEVGLGYEVLETFPGEKINGLQYKPPLLEEVPVQSQLENAHKVVLSKEYVALEEGTGCVHSAPGHGEEDFEVGLKYGLPAISPVDPTGRFTVDAGKYSGKYVKDANKVIIEDLRKKNLLLYGGTVDHKYPHCWRCKTPLILRATEQWFIKVTSFKDKMLEENEKIVWVPTWAGSRRFRDWLLGARDWVVSRQRYWGIPLPIWTCGKCGNREVFGSLDELRESAKSTPRNLEPHKPWVDKIVFKCTCGGVMRRVPDVLDVWMDSGVASWASLGYPAVKDNFEKWWPADFIIEAHDQTRGWFYSQLGAGIVAFNRCPYKCVAMHGHTLSADGKKMSKSLGNFIAPEKVIEKYGSDVLRFYELQCTVWEDFCFKWEELDVVLMNMNVLWNVYNFASTYMNLDKFDPQKWTVNLLWKDLRQEDKWILSRTQSLVETVTNFLDKYHFHEAARTLNEFIVEELSRWYIRLIRRRTWIEKDDPDKLAAYATLYYTLKTFLLLMAPFTPFVAEKLYQEMFKPAELKAPDSIHINDWPKVNKKLVNSELEKEMTILKDITSTAYNARQRAQLKLRWPVRTVTLVPSTAEVMKAVTTLRDALQEQVNCKELTILEMGATPSFIKMAVEPNYSTLGPRLRDRASEVGKTLASVDGWNLMRRIKKTGSYKLRLKDGTVVTLRENDVLFREELPKNVVMAESKYCIVYIDKTRTPELLAEALAKEVVRRVQLMRKEMDLKIEEYIKLVIQPKENDTAELLSRMRDYVTSETRAKSVDIITLKKRITLPAKLYTRDWNIDGEDVKISVARMKK